MKNFQEIKKQFSIFTNQPRLVYLDNAATTQKPKIVIETLNRFYHNENANIHRGIYDLSANATKAYEKVREQTAQFIGASSAKNIGFTKGTTESINIVANGFLKGQLQKGDNVLISAMEHHANLIPWQMLCKETEAELRVINLLKDNALDLKDFQTKIDSKTKLVALVHISNTLGTINPIEKVIESAHQKQIPVLIDAAQSTGLYPINVEKLACDFLVFSAHKAFGPFGTGVLYVSEPFINQIKPINFGGGMIRSVSFEETNFANFPHSLEAGTPNISGVIAWGAAMEFIDTLDRVAAINHIKGLGLYCRENLASLKEITILEGSENTSGIVSFTLNHIHPHDVATFLAEDNIAIRAGHHCTQPLLSMLQIPATIRASFSIYNNKTEIDLLIEKLKEIQKIFT